MQSSTIGGGRLATCSAITSKGTPCRNAPTTGSSYCPAHAPERAEARRRSASIAGRSKPATEVHEVKRQLRKLANDVLSGAVNTSKGSVLSQILRVWLKAAEVEIRERETAAKEREFTEIRLPEFSQLQSEVAELRELLDQQNSSKRSASTWAG